MTMWTLIGFNEPIITVVANICHTVHILTPWTRQLFSLVTDHVARLNQTDHPYLRANLETHQLKQLRLQIQFVLMPCLLLLSTLQLHTTTCILVALEILGLGVPNPASRCLGPSG